MRAASKRPLVSLCIPAYRAQPHLGQVLEHALAQTVDDIEIVVSNDGGHALPALDVYRGHPKLRVHDQRNRLGWVRNTNAALEMARGDYFMVLPHDDFLKPRYLEACLSLFDTDPRVFSAYSDIQIGDRVMIASEARGSLPERVEHIMRHLYNGYSYRALMRRKPADWSLLRMRENHPTNFCVDSTWILQQALFGELRRVPEALYVKNVLTDSARAGWHGLEAGVLQAAWRQHCETMGALARARLGDTGLVDRLVQHRLDPRRVKETPGFLRKTYADAPKPE